MRKTLLVFLLFSSSLFAQDPLLGFDTASSASQRELEAEFDSHLSAEDLDEWLRILSREPHHVGSAAGLAVVEFVADKFRSWGYDTEIAEYEVLFHKD